MSIWTGRIPGTCAGSRGARIEQSEGAGHMWRPTHARHRDVLSSRFAPVNMKIRLPLTTATKQTGQNPCSHPLAVSRCWTRHAPAQGLARGASSRSWSATEAKVRTLPRDARICDDVSRMAGDEERQEQPGRAGCPCPEGREGGFGNAHSRACRCRKGGQRGRDRAAYAGNLVRHRQIWVHPPHWLGRQKAARRSTSPASQQECGAGRPSISWQAAQRRGGEGQNASAGNPIDAAGP